MVIPNVILNVVPNGYPQCDPYIVIPIIMGYDNGLTGIQQNFYTEPFPNSCQISWSHMAAITDMLKQLWTVISKLSS